MARRITIEWPLLGRRVRAELLETLNPVACNDLWQLLPLTSIQSHAVAAGLQMYFPIPLICDPAAMQSEPMDRQPAGRVNIETDFQYLSIGYGTVTEPVPAYPLAQIDAADISVLFAVGRTAWENLLFSNHHLVVTVRREATE